MKHRLLIHRVIAPLAMVGGAMTLLLSCGTEVTPTIMDPETVPTQISHNHKILSSKDGKRQYRFETPLLERYELAKEPFMEFRKGIKIETFADSTLSASTSSTAASSASSSSSSLSRDTSVIASVLTADYAHFNEVSEIWEARGHVVAHSYARAGNPADTLAGKDGSGSSEKWLYTEVLFWDQKKKIIYTHERAKVIDGKSSHYGKGFQADENFDQWSFNNTQGQIEMETPDDSTSTSSSGASGSSTSLSSPQSVVAPGSVHSDFRPVTEEDRYNSRPYQRRAYPNTRAK